MFDFKKGIPARIVALLILGTTRASKRNDKFPRVKLMWISPTTLSLELSIWLANWPAGFTVIFSLLHSLSVIQLASAPQSSVRWTTTELKKRDMMGLGHVSTFLIEGIISHERFLLYNFTLLFTLKSLLRELSNFLEGIDCQMSDESDTSSWSENTSSSSASNARNDALAQACLAALLKLLHLVTQWDV